MLPISTKETVRFTPPKYEGQENAPVYLLGVPTIAGKALLRRELTAQGAEFVSDTILLNTLREGVKAVVAEEQHAELLEIIDQWEAGDKSDKELQGQLAEIESAVRPVYPPYAAIVAAREHYLAIYPLVAAQLFLRGWENVPVPFQQRAGKLTDEALLALPEEDLILAGWEASGLLNLTAEQEKNSVSPSGSPANPASLPAEQAPQTAVDGVSTESSTS